MSCPAGRSVWTDLQVFSLGPPCCSFGPAACCRTWLSQTCLLPAKPTAYILSVPCILQRVELGAVSRSCMRARAGGLPDRSMSCSAGLSCSTLPCLPWTDPQVCPKTCQGLVLMRALQFPGLRSNISTRTTIYDVPVLSKALNYCSASNESGTKA